ncbi:MAG TPA: MoxR family ATPase [Polyangia bacterium]|jgi:MoxR-like ATPase
MAHVAESAARGLAPQALGDRLTAELGQVIVGQRRMIDELLVAICAGGHVLLEGPPGTAKTLCVSALARALRCDFKRVQLTPDLMPADILGTNVFDLKTQGFELRRGPIFTDLLLADEINRAPARTQAALLEGMQERQVTIDGTSHPLPPLFTVIATQNPIEFEGTFPLPEAQLDRFLLKIAVGYPTKAEEDGILASYQAGFDPLRLAERVRAVADLDAVLAARAAVAAVKVVPEVMGYITAIVRGTREHAAIAVGASPRASVALFAAAKAHAALAGRDFVAPDDVQALCAPALRHRVILKPEAEIEGATPDACIAQVVEAVAVPR